MEKHDQGELPRKPVFERPEVLATYDRRELEEAVRPHLPAPGYP